MAILHVTMASMFAVPVMWMVERQPTAPGGGVSTSVGETVVTAAPVMTGTVLKIFSQM